MINELLDNVQNRFVNFWGWLWDPLWQWYFYGGLIFVVCVVIAYFLPFKWIRATLGVILALTAAFIAGGRQMRNTYKDRLDEERQKRLEAERRRNEVGDRATDGGGSFWPFNWK